ncbi:hypothetical protein ACFYE2_00675 [Kocuria sp. CPCC 205300]|uniref:hypothetical protein n=1 Tax=Kocuria sabuli TaxID=3071448 RepID=UPI0036DD252E
MFTDRELAEQSARQRFAGLRETVAAGEEAFVAIRLAEFDANEERWDAYNAAESARREHSIHDLTNKLLGGAA